MGTSFLYETIIQQTKGAYIKITLQVCHNFSFRLDICRNIIFSVAIKYSGDP